MKKTWREKYQTAKEPVVKRIDKNFADMRAGQLMLISTPAEIDQLVRKLPEGTAWTISDLRKELARRHKADITCPVTTGIFVRINAEVALEDIAAGKSPDEVMPFWRVVDPNSPLAKKISCGPDFIDQMRQQEKR